MFDKLSNMGFKWHLKPIDQGAVRAAFKHSNAIDLAKAIINALLPMLKDILDALADEK